MSTCLGLFVQNNLIKYAKITRENETIKIDNYGVKFYENNLQETIDKIVEETYSYKVPISINTSDEKYANTEIFSLLSDTDKKKSIRTEFDYYYNQIGKNRLTVEYRYVLANPIKDSDKQNVLYAYSEKGNIAERIQLVNEHKLTNLCPVALTIPSVTQDNNCIIVNIEDRTEVTTVINGKANSVDIIDLGMKQILDNIAQKENSISKAYEICKNTTLYTEGSENLQTEENEYLEIIVPSIYKIMEQVKQVIDKKNLEIDKIYLTGSAVIINNIDLYFQEHFLNYKCEILSPYFVDKTSLKLNIKDYMEVNSAISLALQGTTKKNKGISFVNKSETLDTILGILNSNVTTLGKKKVAKGVKTKKAINFKLNIKPINFARFVYIPLVILIFYIAGTTLLYNKIDDKMIKAQEVLDDTTTKLGNLNNYISLIDARANNYETVLGQLQEANDRISEAYRSRNAIPNLLSQIMFAVPKEVQILSIQNTEEKHIVIQAQASGYQYLGYLKAEIQNRSILTNVTATSGTRNSDMIQITIEGDLPY